MGLFDSKPRLLGIDLSDSAVKVVEVSKVGKRFQVEGYGTEPLPTGAMENHNPSDMDVIATAIKKAMRSGGMRLKQAVVAVPTSSVITRTLSMPKSYTEDDIEANIQLEAAQYIPFPLDDIHLDFQMLPNASTNPDMQSVMLVASRKENVDLREEALKEAGLKAMIVDVEAYGIENAYLSALRHLGNDGKAVVAEGGERVAIVDIGAQNTILYVFENNRVIFTREQSFGGDFLTQSISGNYGLERDRAELAKRTGELPDDYEEVVAEPFRYSVAEQIGNALQYFFSSSHYNSVDRLLLVGGGSLMNHLETTVTEQLGVPTFIGNPFTQVDISKRIPITRRQLLQREAPLYTLAFGLALRSFE